MKIIGIGGPLYTVGFKASYVNLQFGQSHESEIFEVMGSF